MASNIVRINPASKELLLGFAEARRVSLPVMLDRVIEHYRRQNLFEQANAAYAKLRQDPTAWQSYKRDLDLWDATLMDGLAHGESCVKERASRYTAKRKKRKKS